MQSAPKNYVYDYPRPMVTVDVIIATRDAKPSVLLIRRKRDPYAGSWAIPGGFVEANESLETAARRELFEETGVRTADLLQLHTFGDPGRDPRGHVISVAYLARVKQTDLKPRADDDAAEVGWYPLHRLPELAFDHRSILRMAAKSLAVQSAPKRARKRS